MVLSRPDQFSYHTDEGLFLRGILPPHDSIRGSQLQQSRSCPILCDHWNSPGIFFDSRTNNDEYNQNSCLLSCTFLLICWLFSFSLDDTLMKISYYELTLLSSVCVWWEDNLDEWAENLCFRIAANGWRHQNTNTKKVNGGEQTYFITIICSACQFLPQEIFPMPFILLTTSTFTSCDILMSIILKNIKSMFYVCSFIDAFTLHVWDPRASSYASLHLRQWHERSFVYPSTFLLTICLVICYQPTSINSYFSLGHLPAEGLFDNDRLSCRWPFALHCGNETTYLRTTTSRAEK